MQLLFEAALFSGVEKQNQVVTLGSPCEFPVVQSGLSKALASSKLIIEAPCLGLRLSAFETNFFVFGGSVDLRAEVCNFPFQMPFQTPPRSHTPRGRHHLHSNGLLLAQPDLYFIGMRKMATHSDPLF